MVQQVVRIATISLIVFNVRHNEYVAAVSHQQLTSLLSEVYRFLNFLT